MLNIFFIYIRMSLDYIRSLLLGSLYKEKTINSVITENEIKELSDKLKVDEEVIIKLCKLYTYEEDEENARKETIYILKESSKEKISKEDICIKLNHKRKRYTFKTFSYFDNVNIIIDKFTHLLLGEALYYDILNQKLTDKHSILSLITPTKELNKEEIYNICRIEDLLKAVKLHYLILYNKDIPNYLYKYANNACLSSCIQTNFLQGVVNIINYVEITPDNIIECSKRVKYDSINMLIIFKLLLDNYKFLIPKIVKEILINSKNTEALDLIADKEFELT